MINGSEAPLFKSVQNKNKFRKRKVLSEISEHEENDGPSNILESTKEIQKYRSRSKGMNTSVSSQKISDFPVLDNRPREFTLLNQQFSKQIGNEVEDNNLKIFIEQKIIEKRGGTSIQNPILTEEQKLYLIPDHLKAERRPLSVYGIGINDNETSTRKHPAVKNKNEYKEPERESNGVINDEEITKFRDFSSSEDKELEKQDLEALENIKRKKYRNE